MAHEPQFRFGQILAGRLYPEARSRLGRWLIATPAGLTAAARHALIQDIDLSVPSLLAAVVATGILGALCQQLTGSARLGVMLLVCTGLNGLHAGFVGALVRGRFRNRPVMTDIYLFSKLAWVLSLGVFCGGMAASNVAALQTIGATTALGFQGVLGMRHFQVPRFAMALIFSIYFPSMGGLMMASDHWLLATLALSLPWLPATAMTLTRMRDLTVESHAARLMTLERARRDPLTGALNRLGLRQVLEDEALPSALTMFCLDLDGFKAVNDTLGHPAGDLLLRLVTDRLRRCIREGDALARCGGDEFVIVAPAMGPADAEVYAARLIEKVAGDPYALDGGAVARIGVSVGFGCRPMDAEAMDVLSARADEALYVAKREGKGVWRRAGQSVVG